MSDINSSLPVRTENPGDIVAKIVDGINTALAMTVNADGSLNVTDNGGSLTVDAVDLDIRDLAFSSDKVDVSGSEVALDAATLAALENITVSATDLDIRDLAFATDKVDVSGSSVALDAGTLAALESITVQNGSGGSAVNIQDGGNSITVDAVDLDIRDLSAATDSIKANLFDEAGVAFSSTNPLPVVLLESEGIEKNDYSFGSAIVGGANSNHDYTVTAAKTLQLTQIEASASGKMKIEVQIESGVGTNTFATRFVKFNSTADANISIILKEPIAVAAGVRVRVIRTNRDNQAQDLYSTISGHEV